jgi:hypothetical protein
MSVTPTQSLHPQCLQGRRRHPLHPHNRPENANGHLAIHPYVLPPGNRMHLQSTIALHHRTRHLEAIQQNIHLALAHRWQLAHCFHRDRAVVIFLDVVLQTITFLRQRRLGLFLYNLFCAAVTPSDLL